MAYEHIEKEIREKAIDAAYDYVKAQVEKFVRMHTQHTLEYCIRDNFYIDDDCYLFCKTCKVYVRIENTLDDYIDITDVICDIENKYNIEIVELDEFDDDTCDAKIKTYKKIEIEDDEILEIREKMKELIKEYIKAQVIEFIKKHKHTRKFEIRESSPDKCRLTCKKCKDDDVTYIDTLDEYKTADEYVDALTEIEKEYKVEFEV